MKRHILVLVRHSSLSDGWERFSRQKRYKLAQKITSIFLEDRNSDFHSAPANLLMGVKPIVTLYNIPKRNIYARGIFGRGF